MEEWGIIDRWGEEPWGRESQKAMKLSDSSEKEQFGDSVIIIVISDKNRVLVLVVVFVIVCCSSVTSTQQ